jgi:hypothetical protein
VIGTVESRIEVEYFCPIPEIQDKNDRQYRRDKLRLACELIFVSSTVSGLLALEFKNCITSYGLSPNASVQMAFQAIGFGLLVKMRSSEILKF